MTSRPSRPLSRSPRTARSRCRCSAGTTAPTRWPARWPKRWAATPRSRRPAISGSALRSTSRRRAGGSSTRNASSRLPPHCSPVALWPSLRRHAAPAGCAPARRDGLRATGCWGVAEGAALAAAGPGGALIVRRRQSRRATCAIARAPIPLGAAAIGRPRGRLAIIGIGPGDPAWRTPEASALLAASDDVVGYRLYLDLLGRALAGKCRHDSEIGAEQNRVRLALDLAAEGRAVAPVSSGDAGIYGLAALVFETIDRERRRDWSAVEIAVAPGISAMQAAAARAGAPLGHDFCAISLSDLLTPWPAVRARIEAAASADFVVALYNPRSARRATQLAEAAAILLEHRPPETPVFIARNLGRSGETQRVMRLGELADAEPDMLSLVLIGNRQTRIMPGDPPRRYTPRGYFPGAHNGGGR